MTTMAMTTTVMTTTTTHSHAAVLDSEDTRFNLETRAPDNVTEPGNPDLRVVSGLVDSSESSPPFSTKEDVSRKSELSESHRVEGDSVGAGSTAGTGDENIAGAGDKGPRTRQRQRIAARGVIQLPNQSKTLLSKASTSSLYDSGGHSGDERAGEHEQPQDQTLQQAQDVDLPSVTAKGLDGNSGDTVVNEEERDSVKEQS